MDIIQQIEDYIIYLITECGLSVTLHPIAKERLITFSRLMRFNIHDNSYCTLVKSSQGGNICCLAQQRRVFEMCKTKGTRFSGTCHAGVWECVYPLWDGEEMIGFISVGGYTSPEKQARVKDAACRLGGDKEAFAHAYGALRRERPSEKRLDTLLFPLCHMLELAYRKEEKGVEESLITQILRYVRGHYAEPLTSEALCAQFHCSRSQLSHRFKAEVGVGFREYLLALRLSHAKRLLKYSALTVTEISFAVGFNDANYFSNVFKHREGLSPLAYRRRTKGRTP